MTLNKASSIAHVFPMVAAVICFALYFALVILKTPFDFANPDFGGPRPGQTEAQMVLANEPSDHFRTGAASLLLGLLLAHGFGSPLGAGRRRLAAAILVALSLLITSTFFGMTPLATPFLLWVMALHGMGVAVKGLSRSA